jgi:transposase-like protein
MGMAATERRNRSWPEALKREIVAASFVPGTSVAVVARRYDVNADQVFSWRKRYRDIPPAVAVKAAPRPVPVMVTPKRDAAGSRRLRWRRSRLISAITVSVSAVLSMCRRCGVCSTCCSGDDPRLE